MQDKVDSQPQTTPRRRVLVPLKRTIVIACPVTAILLALLFPKGSAPEVVVYKGRTLASWFYGSRRDFFTDRTRKPAQEAINAVGTNALPFLFGTLEQPRGNNGIYFKLYHATPNLVQAKLPYPILSDDIRAMVLMHLREMRPSPGGVAPILGAQIPGFTNPRLRMLGFDTMLMNNQTDRSFLKLCRKLLNDEHPGIQLQAAIYLAQSAIVSNPDEPKLVPLLLEGLNRQQRTLSLDLRGWYYRQQPAGSPNPTTLKRPIPPGVAGPDEMDQMLRSEVLRGLDRLKPFLTEEQKNCLKKARTETKLESN
jgi:hypothetical protein